MGSSWLTAVKRAFRSPTKDSEKRSSNRRRCDQTPQQHHHQQHIKSEQDDDEDEKKRDKRRWLFRKPTFQETPPPPPPKTMGSSGGGGGAMVEDESGTAEQKHAIAVAVASAAAAEAAVASAQAAMEVIRLARPASNNTSARDQHYAAIVIQTAFRGYLARKALGALKGLVKLQALVRGHNVRKQAKMTLRCMQALVRVQARVLDQRMKQQSHEGSSYSRKSTFSDNNSLWESRYMNDPTSNSDRKSMSRDGSSIADDWDERPHTVEEVKAMLQNRKDAAALKRHSTMAQVTRSRRNQSFGEEEELAEKPPQWLNRWMPTKPWENRGRASTDQRDQIKTVEIDRTSSSQQQQPYSSSSYLPPNLRRPNQSQNHQRPNPQSHASPLHRAHQNNQYSSVTPSPSRTRPVQVRSASPRCGREEITQYAIQTPSIRSNYHYTGSCGVPNYMTATESAKAKARSQSAPRQRPSTPERDRAGSVKKRLSYPVPDPYNVGNGYGGYRHSLKSPSFKSISGMTHCGAEQISNYSSCCTESLGGEISPSSTTDLRRWLR